MQNKIIGIIRLIRPINSVMMGFAVLIGAYIASNDIIPWEIAIIGFFVAFALTGATMALNDYYDVKSDEVNEPFRPIPSGILSLNDALRISIVMATTGIVLSAFINLQSFIIAVIALILMVYYNTIGKKTGLLGNITVSICVAIPFIFGGAMIHRITFLILNYSIFAFLSNLGREIIKGIADIEGDKISEVKTIPILLGRKKAAIISSIFILISVSLSFLPILIGTVGKFYLPFIAAADIGFIWSCLLIITNSNPNNAKRVKKLLLIWMFLGLLGFLMGKI